MKRRVVVRLNFPIFSAVILVTYCCYQSYGEEKTLAETPVGTVQIFPQWADSSVVNSCKKKEGLNRKRKTSSIDIKHVFTVPIFPTATEFDTQSGTIFLIQTW
jgi:hypothetical protein